MGNRAKRRLGKRCHKKKKGYSGGSQQTILPNSYGLPTSNTQAHRSMGAAIFAMFAGLRGNR